MSAASGHQGLWTPPRYAGDAVRILLLKKGDAIGSIRIMQYDGFVRVGSFLPGVPDPASKLLWPERSVTVDNNFVADNAFDEYVQEAYAAFWQNDNG